MKQYIILADLDRCIGCRGGCQAACNMEHETPLGSSRSKLYTMGPTGKFPDLQMYFLPVMCQQCENPACVQACPTGACARNAEDGVVKIDQAQCIGCQKCVRACPYEAIIFDKARRKADKCDICAQRRAQGEEPACVHNCAGHALLFGDMNDPNSSVAKAIREAGEDHVYSLKDDGSRPSGRYILRNADWIDTLPAEYEKARQGGKRHE